MSQFYGHIAALFTSVCWSFNSIAFSLAGKKVGSATVNHIRLWIALLAIIIIHFILYGQAIPLNAEPERWLWLSLSGFVGFTIGDSFFFEALVLIGPRLSTLIMLLAPIFSAILGWIALKEYLTIYQIIAILITTGGIAWVILEKQNNNNFLNKKYSRGIIFGIAGALCQAAGLLLSKFGLIGGFSPISANLIRLIAASTTISLITIFRGAMISDIKKMKNKIAFVEIIIGAMLGPVSGVSLSLIAISYANIGIASTLMQLAPIILLPIGYYFFKERITIRAIIGTIIAILGASLLFLL